MNSRKAVVGGVAFYLLLLLSAAAFIAYRYGGNLSLQQAKAYIEGFGVMAPIVFIAVCMIRGIVFFPCGILSALGGAVFGKLMGTVLTLLGLTAGSVLTFYLARGIGKEWVMRLLGHQYEKYDGYISRDFPYSIFLMRLLPVLPYDVVSCVSGLSGIRLGKFITGTFAGSIPGVFLYVYFGDSVRSMSYKRIGLSLAIIFVFAASPFFYRHLTIWYAANKR